MALTKIKTGGIADNAITNAKMADDAIDSADFADASIDNAHLADDAVNSDEIAAGAIDLAHMSVNSVDSDQYVDGSIDNVHVATGLDAVKLADGTVTNTEFQYINTLSSNAQTQISASLPKAGGTMTGHLILTNNSVSLQYLDAAGTAARVLYQDNADTLILGNPTTVDDIRFDVDTYGEGAMIILSSGKVGIGVTDPDEPLEVKSEAEKGIKLSNSSGTILASIREEGSDAGRLRLFDGGSTKIQLNGSGDSYFNSGGALGIGTGSPDHELHVEGENPRIQIESTSAGADNTGLIFAHGGTEKYEFWHDEDAGAFNFDQSVQTDGWGFNFRTYPSGGSDNTTAMTIKGNGKVGIGTNAPVAKMQVEATSGYEVATGLAYIHKNYATNHPAFVVRQSGTGGNNASTQGMLLDVAGVALGKSFEIQNSGTARVTVLNNGNFGIGTASPACKLHVHDSADRSEATPQFKIRGNGYDFYTWLDGTACYLGQDSAARDFRIFNGTSSTGAGVALADNGDTSWGTYSDERVKRNIVEISGAVEKLKDIRCVNFNFLNDEEDRATRIGIIAQDLIGKYDEALSTSDGWGEQIEDDNQYYSVRYTELIPPLIKAVQELSASNDNLKARIEALENA